MIDYGSTLAPTFVGEGCAAEVVVTGKGSPLRVLVQVGPAAQRSTENLMLISRDEK